MQPLLLIASEVRENYNMSDNAFASVDDLEIWFNVFTSIQDPGKVDPLG